VTSTFVFFLARLAEIIFGEWNKFILVLLFYIVAISFLESRVADLHHWNGSSFTLMRIQVRIRILLLIKVMGISDHRFNADRDPDPDPSFHSIVHLDPDPASKNNADPCGSGSATLLKRIQKETWTYYLVKERPLRKRGRLPKNRASLQVAVGQRTCNTETYVQVS
jgi:hypothetical protein